MYSLTSNVNKVRQPWSTRFGWFSLRRLRKQLLHIDAAEASFTRRCFHSKDDRTRRRLEQIGVTFLLGYEAAIEENDLSALAQRLSLIDRELSGFAFEGAAMGLTLLDALTPWNNQRLLKFIHGAGARHVYMVHVGSGWAIARVPWLRLNLKNYLERLDPLLRWLALDGYGFHEGYFNWPQYVQEQQAPKDLSALGLRAFDQGLGRSLWFIDGADVDRITLTIGKFPSYRRADLWSGIGLACAYAGSVSRDAVEAVQRAAGTYASHLGQGAAFAAKCRQLAGNETEHTDLACQIFAGVSANRAAAVTDEALKDLPDNGAYEVWRERIRTELSRKN
jgi:enediyne biosynthesis protein E3